MSIHRWFNLLLLASSGILFLPGQVSAGPSETLVVNIGGLKNNRGQVCVSLFNRPQTFPMQPENSLASQCVKITKVPMQITFKNLAPGSYAVAALHDANGDGKDNRNFLGIPIEGFGFSRNPTVSTAPPKFEQSAVQVTAPTSISIQMVYLPGS
uniref:DUF2141 domain-containing protein n=1 Tax=Cyanothece sp. (strain PCC 7425 / ATCC 29141) TaxID=395961 RepID=B8HM82_CYAP4